MDKVRVLLADDSQAVREELEAVLRERSDIELVDSVDNGAQAL